MVQPKYESEEDAGEEVEEGEYEEGEYPEDEGYGKDYYEEPIEYVKEYDDLMYDAGNRSRKY